MAYGFIVLSLIGLVPCPTLGQVLTKKHVAESDYALWSTLSHEMISDNGTWVSYRINYVSNIDTTFVYNTQNHSQFHIVGARATVFVNESVFAYIKEDTLKIRNLKNGKVSMKKNIKEFRFSANGKYLVTLDNSQTLEVSQNDKTLTSITNISEFQWNDKYDQIVLTGETDDFSFVEFLEMDKNFKQWNILKTKNKKLDFLKWHPNATSFAFLNVQPNKEALYYYNLSNHQLKVLEGTSAIIPEGFKIAPNQHIPISFSEDNQYLFFGISKPQIIDNDFIHEEVEIWRANEPMLYPNRKLKNSIKNPQYLAVWNHENQTVKQLSCHEFPQIILSAKHDYAIVANPLQYEPQYHWFGARDYYFLDFQTGEKTLFLKKHSGFSSHLTKSPNGSCWVYYKDKHWWSYHIKTKKHYQLSKNINTSWDNQEQDAGNELKVWGIAGWSLDENYVLINDKYDLWALAIDGAHSYRITDGKENEIRYRIEKLQNETLNHYKGYYPTYDLTKPLVLQFWNQKNNDQGYCTYEANGKKTVLFENGFNYSKIKKAKNNEVYLAIKQHFNLPPTLVMNHNKITSTIVKSNPHHEKFH